jgi:hypothetical protein
MLCDEIAVKTTFTQARWKVPSSFAKLATTFKHKGPLWQ